MSHELRVAIAVNGLEDSILMVEVYRAFFNKFALGCYPVQWPDGTPPRVREVFDPSAVSSMARELLNQQPEAVVREWVTYTKVIPVLTKEKEVTV